MSQQTFKKTVVLLRIMFLFVHTEVQTTNIQLINVSTNDSIATKTKDGEEAAFKVKLLSLIHLFLKTHMMESFQEGEERNSSNPQ